MRNEQAKRHRKRLGAYYTPLDLSLALSEWSIRSSCEQILEPGFGGCEFIFAAQTRLRELGAKNAMGQIFGCDVDPRAFAALKQRFGLDHLNGSYLKKDFLTIRPGDYTIRGFDVVLGNPPYVSHHMMSGTQIEAGQLANKEGTGAHISRRASLWAYFVTHGVSLLRAGGRAAWVLPTSFLYADYAAPVREHLSKWFERVIAFRMSERMFTEHQVSEQSVIVLCDRRRGVESDAVHIEVASVDNLHELQQALRTLQTQNWQGSTLQHGYAETSLTDECRDVIRDVEKTVTIAQLGSFVDVRIGLVTGANRFFVLNQSSADAHKLPDSVLVPIVTSSAELIGLAVKSSDLSRARRLNERCLLLDTARRSKLSPAVARYLRTFPPAERKQNVTFAKRDPWHRVNDQRVPDAFFSYMTHRGPKMAMNTARTTSVNAVHRIFRMATTTDHHLKLLAISTASTFSQLSAELCGRTYGDGVLKLEVSEMRRMKVICPKNIGQNDIASVFKELERQYRKQEVQNARDLADDFLLRDYPRTTRATHRRVLTEALEALRETRTRR